MTNKMQDFTYWKTIHKFSEIEVRPNTLILCDIDDTVLHHPAINNTWVDLIHNFFHVKHHAENGHYNRLQSETDLNKYLDEVFESVPMCHTDRDGFFAMLDGAADFAFVTARLLTAKEFTYDNLRELDIDPEKYPVHFSGYVAKGEYINANFDLSKYDRVVFIDDQTRNLENVFLLLFHSNLELYKFEYQHEVPCLEYYPLPPGFNPRLRFDGEILVDIGGE